MHLVCFVAEEMYFFKAFVKKAFQAIRFVPSSRENIKGNLAANRIRQATICKLLSEDVNKFGTELMLLRSSVNTRNITINQKQNETRLIVSLKLIPFFDARLDRVQTQNQNIPVGGCADLAFLPIGLTLIIPFRNSTKVPLLILISLLFKQQNERIPLDWDVHVSDVVQDEVDKLFVLVFANELDKRL